MLHTSLPATLTIPHKTMIWRRWFSIHVMLVALFNLLYTTDPLLICLKASLTSSVVLHFGWFYLMLYANQQQQRVLAHIHAQTTPPLLNASTQQPYPSESAAASDFWYQWHNL